MNSAVVKIVLPLIEDAIKSFEHARAAVVESQFGGAATHRLNAIAACEQATALLDVILNDPNATEAGS